MSTVGKAAVSSRQDDVAILRELIVVSAPNPEMAAPVRDCPVDAKLDECIPFSSVIVLGVVIAVEDHYGIRITRQALNQACAGGATLTKLADMLSRLRQEQP